MWTNAAWARTTVLPTQLAPTPMVATSVRVTQAFPGTARHVQILTNASSTSTVVMLTLYAPTQMARTVARVKKDTLATGSSVKVRTKFSEPNNTCSDDRALTRFVIQRHSIQS